jgi:type VI secretion system protein ImpK
LVKLVKPFFDYLVAFRMQAKTPYAPTLMQLNQELQQHMNRIKRGANQSQDLEALYNQIRYPLCALADEIIINSGWEQADEWEKHLLERKFFGTNVAGNRFFEFAESLEESEPVVAFIYYYCLALGFCGQYLAKDPRLEKIKQRTLDIALSNQENGQFSFSLNSDDAQPNSFRPLPYRWTLRWTIASMLCLVAVFFLFDRFVMWNLMTFKLYALIEKVDGNILADSQKTLNFDIPKQAPPIPLQSVPNQSASIAGGITAGQSTYVALPDIGDGFAVQLGAFKEKKNSVPIFDKLKSAGYEPMLVDHFLDPDQWYLVIIGPYATQVEAEAVKQSILATIKTGAIVRPRNEITGHCLKGCPTT